MTIRLPSNPLNTDSFHNDNRFVFNYNDVETEKNKEKDNRIMDVEIGQYVLLNGTNQVVKVIEKPFLMNEKIISDYLGLDIENNRELLFNNNNITSIVEEPKSVKTK